MTWRVEDVQKGDTFECLEWNGASFIPGEFYQVVRNHGVLAVVNTLGNLTSVPALYELTTSARFISRFEHIPMNLEND